MYSNLANYAYIYIYFFGGRGDNSHTYKKTRQ